MKKYDYLVYIGRFQPTHTAHLATIKRAAELADNVLIILGSSKLPRTYKNPFTEDERSGMISAEIKQMKLDTNVYFRSAVDYPYNDNQWISQIQDIVNSNASGKIGLIGYKKDESSFYLNSFPQWDFINQDAIEPLHATDIRELYFKPNANLNYLRNVLPKSTFFFLEMFKNTDDYNEIVNERIFIDSYKQQYVSFPYPPIFVTTDAVVTIGGHVLLVKRRAYPGKGLLALPGGFVNANTDRSIQDAMLRELKEETKIKVPLPVLTGNIKSSRVFDAIDRSSRGRTITHAYHIQLPDGELPKVKGSDDALVASWVPISSLDRSNFFEDHYHIITTLLGI